METALRALLMGDATLTALVPAARIVWNHLPQATERPAIVLYKVSGAPGLTMRGADGLVGSIVQIDALALSVSSMWAIRSALVDLLHGYKGGVFDGIFLRSERQDSDELAGGILAHRASLDFDVWASA